MKMVILLFIGIISAQTYTVDRNILYEVEILNTTYIMPAMHSVNPGDHKEHMLLLKLNTLMLEITDGRHPNHRSKDIIELAKKYVELSKHHDKSIMDMNYEMEVYLGKRKPK
jgi:hypothetical protein